MGRKFQKMGMRASHTAEVVLHDVTVPGRCLLGGKDRLDERIARAREVTDGNSSATTAAFEATRPAVAAQAVGIARAAYEYASTMPSSARPSGVRSSSVRPLRSSLPT